jgi:hemerythrin-like domain-containing protein
MSLKEQIREAKQSVVNALKPDEERTSDADVLDTLKQEHDAVKNLLANLQNAETAAIRQELVRRLTEALVPHSEAEEKVVYASVIVLSDPQAQVDGYEGVLEHKWAAKTLEQLSGLHDAASSEHRATAKVLKELVEHHIKEEEHNIWHDIRKYCSSADRARMNTQYLAEKQKVKVPSTN